MQPSTSTTPPACGATPERIEDDIDLDEGRIDAELGTHYEFSGPYDQDLSRCGGDLDLASVVAITHTEDPSSLKRFRVMFHIPGLPPFIDVIDLRKGVYLDDGYCEAVDIYDQITLRWALARVRRFTGHRVEI